MVFGKWFGRRTAVETPAAPPRNTELERLVMGLDPAMKNATEMILGHSNIHPSLKQSFIDELWRGDFDKARQTIRTLFLPKFSKHERERLIGGGGGWASITDLWREDICWPREKGDAPEDSIRLAFQWANDKVGQDVLFHGDGHLLTVAPTGAGKGQHFILRTLLDYQGPAVVLDPKGENFRETAWRRNLFGPIYKWAPFESDSDCYNPLEFVTDWDDARVLADLIIVNDGPDHFWNMAARNLLSGLIMFVLKSRPPERQNIREVCRVLASGADGRKEMILTLKASDDDNLVDLGNRVEQLQENERLRESIYESLNTQLDVWRTREIVATTSATTPRMSMKTIVLNDHSHSQLAAATAIPPGWSAPERGVLVRGAAATIYVVIPPDKIGTYRSVLRVLLGQMLKSAMSAYDANARYEAENPTPGLPSTFPWWPMLFLFDEFPQLGYMAPIEEAISTARSYNVRLWLFTQNLAQLSQVYEGWQSIMSGCRAQIFFRPNDMETATHVSERIGIRKDVWGGQDWIATPQAIMGPDFKKDCVIFMPNVRPIRAEMFDALYENEPLKAQIEKWRRMFGDQVHRAPRPEAPILGADVISADALKPPADEFQDDEEYRREIEEATRRAAERRRARDEGTPKPPSFD